MTGLKRSAVDGIREQMVSFVRGGTVAGLVTLVAVDGEPASIEAAGAADRASNTMMRPDTIFQVRSMTKPITATGIMILAEQGRLGLDDAVAVHLPGFADAVVVEEGKPRACSRPPTIRDLLTHTSGMTNDEDFRSFAVGVSLAEGAEILASHPFLFDPGERYLYTDAGYAVLGRVIEIASGMDYEAFVSQHILEPLGMTDSFFLAADDRRNRIATAYELRDGTLHDPDEPDLANWPVRYVDARKNPAPAWGMFSTAGDLFAFFQMMLNGGAFNDTRVLAPETVDAMTKLPPGQEDVPLHPQSFRPPGTSYGLGWHVNHAPSPTGWGAGTFFNAGTLYTTGWGDPNTGIVGIFLAQRSGGTPLDSWAELWAFMSLVADSTT
jgi:CubicO group peptidase (beta-lactamase class C family)